jgi:hypothetical protein
MIAGSDFVADLLAFLDIMEPVVDLMICTQALDTPMCKIKLWWPKVKAKLIKAGGRDMEAFSRLQKAKIHSNLEKHSQVLNCYEVGSSFKTMELMLGKNASNGACEKRMK